MPYISGMSRNQTSLFPERLDELIPVDHMVRVIEGFVARLDLAKLGFTRAQPARTGRPGYDPGDLLRLYVWGYLNRIRSSRQLERECARNLELMWLLNRLAPDFKTIADFRRDHERALGEVCRTWVWFCRDAGLLGGEWVAIDGSKFGAVASGRTAFTAKQLAKKRAWVDAQVRAYMEALAQADAAQGDRPVGPDTATVEAALARLADRAVDFHEVAQAMSESGRKHHVHGEPEARLMPTSRGIKPAYNVQTAVDAAHDLIVSHEVTSQGNDKQQLQPMAEAAKAVMEVEMLKVVADSGYSNGAQADACERQGIEVHVPPQRAKNSTGDGTLFAVEAFEYDATRDTFRCPAGAQLVRVGRNTADLLSTYRTTSCAGCALKPRCTTATQRSVTRHDHEAAFTRMTERLKRTPQALEIRRNTVEHPFGTLKQYILVGGRFLLRHLRGARTEMALGALAYNMRRAVNALGSRRILAMLAAPG